MTTYVLDVRSHLICAQRFIDLVMKSPSKTQRSLIAAPLALAEQIAILIGSLAVWGIVLLVFGQVFARYVLRLGLPWPDELARYLHIVLVFLGLAYVLRHHLHVRVDVFYELFPRILQAAVFVLAQVLTCTAGIVIAVGAYRLSERMGHALTPALGMPLTYFFLPTVIGFSLVAAEALRLVFLGIFRGERFTVEESED